MRNVYLGIDQGTTGITVLALERRSFRLLGRGYRHIGCTYPHPGWVEHDPEEIWQALLGAVREALERAGAGADQVACIGLDHEGETCLFFDRLTGEALTPAVVWQDRRAERMLSALTPEEVSKIRAVTGLVPDAYFSAPKLCWLLQNSEPLRRRAQTESVMAGNLDSYLLCRMTGNRHAATDVSTASRTMMMDLSAGTWDPGLAARFGLETRQLPVIRDSSCLFGTTDRKAFLGIEAPVMALMTDQQAALFGENCFRPSDTKVTLGTGGFIYRNIGGKRPSETGNVLPTAAWRIKNEMTYALSGDIYIAGAAVSWLRSIGLVDSPAQTEEMARAAGSESQLVFVPAFSGLASPYWDSAAGGLIIGLHGGTTRQDIVRAVLESTAYQVADVLDEMDRVTGVRTEALKADGGMVRNGFLMQFMADITNRRITAAEMEDATAEGVAKAAALCLGDFSRPEDLPDHSAQSRTYVPGMAAAERGSRLERWHRAVERSLGWQQHS